MRETQSWTGSVGRADCAWDRVVRADWKWSDAHGFDGLGCFGKHAFGLGTALHRLCDLDGADSDDRKLSGDVCCCFGDVRRLGKRRHLADLPLLVTTRRIDFWTCLGLGSSILPRYSPCSTSLRPATALLVLFDHTRVLDKACRSFIDPAPRNSASRFAPFAVTILFALLLLGSGVT